MKTAFSLRHEETRLQNGAKIVSVPIPYASSVTVMVIVHAGPRFDPIGKTGLSHVIEHIKIQSEWSRKKIEPSLSELEEYGSSLNGFTYFETNKYWLHLVPEFALDGVKYLCQIINRSDCSAEDLAKEKKTIMEEMRIIESNPEKKIWEIWAKHIFQGTPLANDYIGDEANLQHIENQDVSNFINQFYRPERITFLFCGNVSNKFLKSASDYINIGLTERNQLTPANDSLLALENNDVISVHKTSTKTLHVMVGFRTVPRGEKMQYTFEVIQSYLNGGYQSIFAEKLRTSGLVYFTYLFVVHLSDAGYFSISFTALPNNLNTVLKVIYDALNNLKDGNINEQRLEKAKNYTIFHQILQLDGTKAIADYFARQIPYSNNVLIDPQQEEAMTKKVTSSDVHQAAKKYFSKEALRIAIVGNVENQTISLDF